MSVTVVLDGAGLHAMTKDPPPQEVLVVIELLRGRGAGRVLSPSVVAVEALTGSAADAPVNRVLKKIGVEEHLPIKRARRAASLRQGTEASAVDAVVAEAAIRTDATYLITSDPGDMRALTQHTDRPPHIIAV